MKKRKRKQKKNKNGNEIVNQKGVGSQLAPETGGKEMNKAIFYITPEGVEVIDNTPEAEIRLSSMEYVEERHARKNKKSRKNPLWKIAGLCGII